MKRRFILCLLVALFAKTGLSQNAITQVTYFDSIVKTIVKEYNYPTTISYVETTKNHYFAYADQSMTVINCEIDTDIYVRDFVIWDGNVIFCGIRNGTQTSGIWGSFKISDLKNSNLSYDVYENFECKLNVVDTLHRIVAYDYNGITHIVTVGTTTDGKTTNGCTIDITPNPNGNTVWSYTIGVTPDVSGERINRICVTDNLVVTSGISSIMALQDSYRCHWKSNIFATGGPQDNLWVFVYSTYSPYAHNPENYEITHITNDIVGMAIQTSDFSNPNHPYGILAMAYNMTTLSNGTISTIYQHYKPTYDYQFNIDGFKYDDKTQQMLVLLNGDLPYSPLYGSGSIVAEIPLLSINITTNTLQGHKLTSLDMYNSNQNFLCQGLNLSLPNVSTYLTQTIGTTAVCTTQDNNTVTCPEFLTKWNLAPYTLCNEDFDCTNLYQLNAFSIQNDIICSD